MLWTIASTDGSLWQPSISDQGVVSVTDEPAVGAPAVLPGVGADWVPAISTGGVVSLSSSTQTGLPQAQLVDAMRTLWSFAADANGQPTVSDSQREVFMSTFYTDSAFMHWAMNPENDLAGYIIYLGNTSRQYNRVTTGVGLCACSTAQPGATVGGIQNGVLTYAAVTAYDQSGNESTFSAEVTMTKNVPLLHLLRQVK